MRHFLCGECIKEKNPGTRKIYERSEIGEPAEFERVMTGFASIPNPDQRWMAINGVRESLPLDYYNCDLCNAEVKPGEPCGTWTVWTEATGPIEEWEYEFLGQGAGPRAAAGNP